MAVWTCFSRGVFVFMPRSVASSAGEDKMGGGEHHCFNIVVPAQAGTTIIYPRFARSFSFWAMMLSRAVFQSSSLQSRSW